MGMLGLSNDKIKSIITKKNISSYNAYITLNKVKNNNRIYKRETEIRKGFSTYSYFLITDLDDELFGKVMYKESYTIQKGPYRDFIDSLFKKMNKANKVSFFENITVCDILEYLLSITDKDKMCKIARMIDEELNILTPFYNFLYSKEFDAFDIEKLRNNDFMDKLESFNRVNNTEYFYNLIDKNKNYVNNNGITWKFQFITRNKNIRSERICNSSIRTIKDIIFRNNEIKLDTEYNNFEFVTTNYNNVEYNMNSINFTIKNRKEMIESIKILKYIFENCLTGKYHSTLYHCKSKFIINNDYIVLLDSERKLKETLIEMFDIIDEEINYLTDDNFIILDFSI